MNHLNVNSNFSLQENLMNLDMFGVPINLKVNGLTRIKTPLGLIISIIIYAVTITLICTIGIELLDKKKPNSNMTDKYQQLAPLINFTKFQIIWPLYFADSNYKPINDPTILNILITFSEYIRNEENVTRIRTPLNLFPCENYKYFFDSKNFTNDYFNNNFKNASCFDYTNDNKNNIIIGGSFNSEYYSQISIFLNKCVNSTNSNIICKPQDEIDKRIKKTFFQFYFIDNYIDTIDYSHPINPFLRNYFTRLDPGETVYSYLSFKLVTILSDIGLIFEEKNYMETVIFDRVYEQNNPIDGDSLILRVSIDSSPQNRIFNRLYIKLPDVIASIGGILKVLWLISAIVMSLPKDYKIFEYFIQEHYEKEYNILNNKKDFDYINLKKSFESIIYNSKSKFIRSRTGNLKNKINNEINLTNKNFLNKPNQEINHISKMEESKDDLNNLQRIIITDNFDDYEKNNININNYLNEPRTRQIFNFDKKTSDVNNNIRNVSNINKKIDIENSSDIENDIKIRYSKITSKNYFNLQGKNHENKLNYLKNSIQCDGNMKKIIVKENNLIENYENENKFSFILNNTLDKNIIEKKTNNLDDQYFSNISKKNFKKKISIMENNKNDSHFNKKIAFKKKFDFIELMKFSFCPKNILLKKNETRDKYIFYNNINKFFDYFYFIKRLRENHLVKKLIFNENQLSLIKIMRNDILYDEINDDAINEKDIKNIYSFYVENFIKKNMNSNNYKNKIISNKNYKVGDDSNVNIHFERTVCKKNEEKLFFNLGNFNSKIFDIMNEVINYE